MYQWFLQVGRASFGSLTFIRSAVWSRGVRKDCPLPRLMYVVVACLVLISIQSVLSAQPAQNDATALIAEAKSLREKNEQEKALATIQKAISIDPRNPAARVQLAMIYSSMENEEKARLAVEEALKLDPNYAPAHQQRGAQLRRAGDYEGAVREAKLALSLKPDAEFTANAHLTLGLTFAALKRHGEAADEFREAIRINPNDGYTYNFLGAALFEMRNYEEAEQAFRRVIQLRPQDSAAHHNLAAALQNQGNRVEAIRYYQETLRLDPKAENRADIERRIEDMKGWLGYELLQATWAGDASKMNAQLDKGADPNYIGAGGENTPLRAAAWSGRLDLVKLLLARGANDDHGGGIAAAYEKGHTEIEKLLEGVTRQPRSPKALSRILLAAVNRGDITKVETTLSAGADEKDAALDKALDQKTVHDDIVRLLLDKGARVNPTGVERTPLMLAAYKGNVDLVKLLLAKGANVNARGRLVHDNRTPIALAVEMDHVEVAKLLLAAGADAKEEGLLGLAASAPSLSADDPRRKSLSKPSAEILRLLLDKGANAKSPAGDSALMSANSPEKAKLLLAHGANPNTKGQYGLTALHAAATEADPEIIGALLHAGAEVNAKDSSGDTPLIKLLYKDDDDKQAQTITKDYAGAVRALLRDKNINVNAQNEDGETALMRAVKLGNAEVVRLLLAARADPNVTDDIGDTAFTLAYQKGDAQIEKLLDSAGPMRPTPRALNAFLVAAIKKKEPTKVKELLNKGADPNHAYSLGLKLQGTTNIVLVLAAQVDHAGIVQMLLDRGADVNAKGLIGGSESGLEHGTALDAAQDPAVREVLKKAMSKKP